MFTRFGAQPGGRGHGRQWKEPAAVSRGVVEGPAAVPLAVAATVAAECSLALASAARPGVACHQALSRHPAVQPHAWLGGCQPLPPVCTQVVLLHTHTHTHTHTHINCHPPVWRAKRAILVIIAQGVFVLYTSHVTRFASVCHFAFPVSHDCKELP